MIRTCRKCGKDKCIDDFYKYKGAPRGECKKCSIKRNVKHQREVRAWQARCQEEDSRRAYMRAYYQKNKEKFAEYRRQFRSRHPSYYKQYYISRKANV